MQPADNKTAVKVWNVSSMRRTFIMKNILTERQESARRTTWTMTTNAPSPEAIASRIQGALLCGRLGAHRPVAKA